MNTFRVLIVVGAVILFAIAAFLFSNYRTPRHELLYESALRLIQDEKYNEAIGTLR